jgi:hypothetical protein
MLIEIVSALLAAILLLLMHSLSVLGALVLRLSAN